ncbi:hypothetical protein N692_05240 [Lactiplantibacillus plantarum EGD-AQ4]|nr:hypothetical protein N692_05240 [Lactiplantibacillus plantarum EGD-AQ4]
MSILVLKRRPNHNNPQQLEYELLTAADCEKSLLDTNNRLSAILIYAY